MANPLNDVFTKNGHNLKEVVSALQKAVRRGRLDDALYFATDMYVSGYAEYAWKRLRIMVSEDIGPANPNLPANFHALYQFYDMQKKKGDVVNEPEKLFFVHAVVLVATSSKSRIVDHALCHHFIRHEELRREIPDYALDKHTVRGRRMGRGMEHFFDVGIKLENEVGDDPYKEKAREAFIKPAGGSLFPVDRDED